MFSKINGDINCYDRNKYLCQLLMKTIKVSKNNKNCGAELNS